MEFIIGKMVKCIEVNGLKIEWKARVNLYGLMGESILASSKRIKEMDMVNTIIKMELSTMDIGRAANNMDRVSIYLLMDGSKKVFGMKARESSLTTIDYLLFILSIYNMAMVW